MTEPIAVVGMACRFPGAPDLDTYWDLLRSGREGLTRFPDADLDARGVPRTLRERPGYVPVGGLIDDQDRFDPAPFGLTDAEAALLDPQQRLFLQCAWHALEHAGHLGGRDSGSVGVFAGSMQSAYLANNLTGRWDPTGGGPDPLGSLATAMATQPDYLPLQVAYRLDLTGPAVAVATSCSTSLVAVHLAAQSLLAGECDTALAGGVSLIVPQGQGYLHVPDGVFSADGTVRPFGAGGTGIVYTQGVGVVVLRRLADALASDDDVLAVLHGTAVNNDGADKAGFTAPSVRGQARAVAEALAVAGVEPAQVGMLEAHGTATPLGDPIELAALRRVFGDGPAWCGIGSVKGNIGHSNSAAGVASFIKTVLALRHRTLPATLHAEPVNPALGLAGSPFALLTDTRPWDTPPHAGVSSFGIGGTNAHAVLGPAPARPAPAPAPDQRPTLLVVSAATAEAARDTATAVAAMDPGVDAAHTLAVGRRLLPYRVAAAGAVGLRSAPVVRAGRPRLLVAFPGAGSPYPGMGGPLHRTEPVFAQAVDECAALLAPHLGADVRDALDPRCPPARIADPGFGLPALFAVSYGLARLFASWGARPDALVGHSLGECVAAAVSGALPLPSATRLVAARCLAASRAAAGGAMLAVALDELGLAPYLAAHPDVDLAAVNAPGACTVSGPAAAVDALAADLASAGVDTTRLQVAAAMHSRRMEAEQPALRAALGGLTGGPVTVPVHSTLDPVADLADPEHWVRQLRAPVRFSDALRAALDAEPGRDTVLLELGPGSTLCGLARRHAHPALRATVSALPDPDADEQASVRAALGVLWAHGATADPTALSDRGARRTAVPGYAFERRRLWIDPPGPAAPSSPVDATQPLQLPGWELAPPIAPAGRGERWRVTGAGPLADALRRAVAPGTSDEPVGVIVVLDGPAADPSTGAVRDDGGPDGRATGSVVDGVAAFAAAVADLPAGPVRLLLVTRGGERIGTGPAPHPTAAALRVLPRVLGQERPELTWAALDLAPTGEVPTDVPTDVAAVLAEAGALAAAPEPGVLLARRGDARWRRTLTPWSPAPGAAAAPGGAGAVLIIGGLGAVGRALARHLAGQGHRVVLTTRSEPGDPVGAGITVRRCDATDPDATAALLAELSADGPLAAVVHAAAVIAGAELDPLRALDGDRLAAHVRAKLGGALALRAGIDALASELRPRAVLLMSSVVTLLGGVGTAAYAAATAAMDAVGAGAGWTSLVWDGWHVGVESTALAGALDAATGAAALDRILAAPAVTAVAVATTDLRPRITAASAPRPAAGPGRERADGTAALVAEVWSELFGTPVTDPDSDFFALGGHSLLGTRMLLALRERCGVELRLRELLETPTVAGLAARIDGAQPVPAQVPAAGDGIAEDGTFPMTRVQHAYWVGRSGGYDGGDVPCWFALAYDGNLDVPRLETAWNAVIARHPMLRAVTTPDGRFTPVDPVPRYRIRTHDLTGLGDERRQVRLAALWTRVATRPGPSDRWPLITLQAVLLPGGRVRILVGVDVLVCDAASWWIVESELQALYRDPAAQLPAPAAHPAARLHTDEEPAAAYWRARTLPGPPALPVNPGGGGVFVRRSHRLAAPDWAALRAAAARHRVTPAAVLLTAFTDELARWSGTAGFSVVLTQFDRPPGFDGVVGDFTSLVLHEVPTSPAPGFARRAAATQALLFADLDHRAHSAIDVLAEQSTRTGERIAVPVVFTSALGVGDDGDTLEWMGEQVDALSSTPQTWLDHQVLEVAGELRLQWDSPDGLLPAAELDAVVARHADRLRELARDPDAWRPEVDPADVVLPLNTGNGRRPVLALVHPSGGDVLCYAGLARALDGIADVVALTDPQLAGVVADGPETVPGIAAGYLDALRAAGYRGPWLLGGWSMGGTVAQEMAVQAHGAGEQVALLAMLDSNDPTHIRPVPGADPEAVELEVALRHLRALEAYLGIDLDTGPAADLTRLPAAQRRAAVARRLREHGLLGRGEPDSTATARLAVFARHLRALAAHTPHRHPDPRTHTLLVRADRAAPRNSGIGMGVDDTPPDRLADLGWNAHLTGPLHVVGADAHHYGLLHPPALAAVADAVRAALTTALDRAPALPTLQRTP